MGTPAGWCARHGYRRACARDAASVLAQRGRVTRRYLESALPQSPYRGLCRLREGFHKASIASYESLIDLWGYRGATERRKDEDPFRSLCESLLQRLLPIPAPLHRALRWTRIRTCPHQHACREPTSADLTVAGRVEQFAEHVPERAHRTDWQILPPGIRPTLYEQVNAGRLPSRAHSRRARIRSSCPDRRRLSGEILLRACSAARRAQTSPGDPLEQSQRDPFQQYGESAAPEHQLRAVVESIPRQPTTRDSLFQAHDPVGTSMTKVAASTSLRSSRSCSSVPNSPTAAVVRPRSIRCGRRCSGARDRAMRPRVRSPASSGEQRTPAARSGRAQSTSGEPTRSRRSTSGCLARVHSELRTITVPASGKRTGATRRRT